MKKILVIPSWYPSIDEPWSGTFFREQTLLFQPEHEFKVLLTKEVKTGRIGRIANTLLFLSTNIIRLSKLNNHFIEPPKVEAFEYAEKINRFKSINFKYITKAYLQGFAEIIKTWKPDIIHAHVTRKAGMISYSIYRQFGIPYIISEHNQPTLFDSESFVNHNYLEAINNAKKILMVGQKQKQILVSLGVKENIEVIGNFVDEHKFLPVEKNNRKFIILFIGFFIPEKDYLTLINTIKEYSDNCKDKNFYFRIIGCGNKGKEFILQQLKNSAVLENVEIIPFVKRSDIPFYQRNSDVFLSTSIYETFGVSMCEAMMCGNPVVSTDNGGFDEMYVPGVNGIKCNTGDYKQLAEALLEIKKKEVQFSPHAIRESVLAKFGTQAFKHRLNAIYNNI